MKCRVIFSGRIITYYYNLHLLQVLNCTEVEIDVLTGENKVYV